MMPNYINPVNGQSYAAPQYPQMQWAPPPLPQAQYMIQADGEMAARAWNIPANVAPGTVIPIWDVDGVHVYFKSIDSYGRLNPLRKARIVFEDTPVLPEGASGAPATDLNLSQYATKADIEQLGNSIRQMLNEKHQNGSNCPQNQGQQRGGSENS